MWLKSTVYYLNTIKVCWDHKEITLPFILGITIIEH